MSHLGVTGMFLPLRSHGTDIEENGVRGGGGMLLPNRVKTRVENHGQFFTDLSASGASEDFFLNQKM